MIFARYTRSSAMLLQSFLHSRSSVEFEIESPFCVIHTRTGSIPHLTRETLNFLDSSIYENFFQIPLPSVINYVDIVKEGGGINECFSLPPQSLSYVVVQDFSRPAVHGYNTKNSVAIWRSAGKLSITSEMFMKAIEAMQPDIYEVLADCDVIGDDSRKRVLKSMERSLQFLEDCINFHKASKVLKQSNFMCTIVGGHLLEERKQYIRLMLGKLQELEVEPCGFVIGSLPVDHSLTEEMYCLIKSTIEILPPDKQIAAPGFGHPFDVISLMKCGVSIFDSSYITKLSESSFALVYQIPKLAEINDWNYDKQTFDLNRNYATNFNETISLSDSSYCNDFSPLLTGCTCYTCSNHTKAYLHHLVNVNEMLAPTLIMLHNLHHHFMFFKTLREIKSTCQLDLLHYHLVIQNVKEKESNGA